MKRELKNFVGHKYDVVIIGGGIYGACIAWDAALRGLSVALVEKGDFGSATSSNSLKIIHGGLRYLQHADFKRMRESITERKILMGIAPHLVHPLPCVMPTYGHALKGKEVMAVALLVNDLVGYDRNTLPDPQKYLPRGRIISKQECQEFIPGVTGQNLSGGAVWYDCQVYNPERLLISILRSAVEAGAVAANYVEMIDFIKSGDAVTGIKVRDTLSGDEFEIQAKLAINSAGPWVNNILSRLNGYLEQPKVKLSCAMNLVVRKPIFSRFAVGLWSRSHFQDQDAVISKGSRLFFIVPWRNYSLIGTTHLPFTGDPNQFKITEKHIQTFIDEINAAYPPANLTREDISFYYGGMLPMDNCNEARDDVKLLKHYRIIDHQKVDGIEGLISVIGVKFTTARDVAQKTVDHVFRKIGKKPPQSLSSRTSIWGGEIEKFQEFLTKERLKQPLGLRQEVVEHLVFNYGSNYSNILKYSEENPEWGQTISENSEVLTAEIIHAIREEMALKLSDVVRRRTELGSAECPDSHILQCCAQIMAEELAWDSTKIKREIEETKSLYETAVE